MGYVYALLAAVLFGANGSLTKVIVDAGLTPTQLSLFRVVGTALIAGAILLITDRGAFRVRPRQLFVLALLGILGVAVLQASYAGAIHLLPVGIALLLEYTAVLMVALVSLVLFRERVKPRLWVAVACVLIGLAIVARIWASQLEPIGVLVALLAAVSLTVYFVGGERLLSSMKPMTVAFWTMSSASVFWALFSGWWNIPPGLLSARFSLGGNLSSCVLPLWALLVTTVVLGSFAPFLLSFLGLRRLSATTAGVVASSEVIFAFITAWLWLGEGLDTVQLIGAAVVLAGIIIAQTARSTHPTPRVGGRT